MKLFKSYLISLFLLLVLTSAGTVIYYNAQYPGIPGPILNDFVRHTHVDEIQAQTPGIVLLGDSTLMFGVDEHSLETLLGENIYMIGYPGSTSAIWYLITEDIATESTYHPPYLVIFFRYTMLTTPEYGVTGRLLPDVDDFASQDDYLLLELAYINPMNPVERFAERYLPIYDQRQRILTSIEHVAKYVVVGNIVGEDRKAVDLAMDYVFDYENLFMLNISEEILYTPEHMDFDRQINQSFLPEIIRLTRDNGIQLILVRVWTRPGSFPGDPDAMDAYSDSLGEYLKENNVILLDFSRDERLIKDYFYDDVHMTEEGMAVFTNLLAKALSPILEGNIP